MGHYDLPTMLGYVSHVTKSRDAREPGEGIVYIGHSMGTTAFWVMCNEYGAHWSCQQTLANFHSALLKAHTIAFTMNNLLKYTTLNRCLNTVSLIRHETWMPV